MSLKSRQIGGHTFAALLLAWVAYVMSSLERIQSYIDIEHEPKPTDAGKPPASWPSGGELRVEGLTASYSSVIFLSMLKRLLVD